MLFAQFSNNAHFIIFLVLMVVGFAKIGTWLKGNDAAKGVAKKGLLALIARLFGK
jgi:hypothetical protein